MPPARIDKHPIVARLTGINRGLSPCSRQRRSLAVRGQVRVRALGAIAGSRVEDETIDALIDAKIRPS
jgi:hypothetical protein